MTPPILPIGKIKSFGVFGPKYQIIEEGRPAENGEWLVPIKVIESGKKLDCRYSRLALDPDAL